MAASLTLSLCAVARGAGQPAAAPPSTLKLATWNLEWLIAPAEFKPLKKHCAPEGTPVAGNQRRLPCDVVNRFERSSRDFATLARYARQLDADVIALQEVDGAEAARLVFPGYAFCFTSRRHVQNNGFAIRAGIPHRCAPDVVTLSLGDTLRRGAELVMYPGEPYEMRLLSVHLKSGCSDKPLDGPDKACRTLARQVPALDGWIDARAAAHRPFALLGDFNRDLLGEPPAGRPGDGHSPGVWAEIDDGVPAEADLRDAAEGERFRNCAPGGAYGAFIDHIVLSRALGGAIVPGSFQRVTFSATDARHAVLSDHCPVAVRVSIRQIATAGGH